MTEGPENIQRLQMIEQNVQGLNMQKQQFQAQQMKQQQEAQQQAMQAQQKRETMQDKIAQMQMQLKMTDSQFGQWLDKTEQGRKFKDDQVKQANIASDNMRADEQLAWDKFTDLLEYDLEKTQKRPAAIS